MAEKPEIIVNGCNGNNFPHDLAAGLTERLQTRQTGRVSKFTPGLAEIILDSLIDGGTIAQACQNAGIDRHTYYAWCRFSPDFLHAVTRAQEDRADSMVDDGFAILDDADHTGREGMAALRKAEQRARYRLEIAKSLNFRKYGDKKQQLNVNLNADVSEQDITRWFNK